MKVELSGIDLEDAFDLSVMPDDETSATPNRPRRIVMATLDNRTERHYSSIRVPVEMVGDAKVGDEFTLYLERVTK